MFYSHNAAPLNEKLNLEVPKDVHPYWWIELGDSTEMYHGDVKNCRYFFWVHH